MDRKKIAVTKIESVTLAVLTHALKTPLTTIRANAQLSHKAVSEHKPLTTQPLENIIRNADRMSGMLDAISLSTKLNSKEFVPELQQIDLPELVRKIIANVSKIWKRTIILKEIDSPMTWLGDEVLFSTLLSQLLTNAIIYSPEHTDIVVKLSANQKSMQISVTDSGKGIVYSQLQQMKKSNFSTIESQTGLGIGLHLCYEIITIYKGTM